MASSEPTSAGWLPPLGGVPHTSAVGLLRDSIQKLIAHARGTQAHAEVRALPQGDRRVQFQVWWTNSPSPVGRTLLWDLVDVTLDDTTSIPDVYRALSDAGLPLNLAGEVSTGGLLRKAPTRGFKYHPVRFRSYHPIGKAMAQFGQGCTVSAFTQEGMNAASAALMASQNARDFPVRDRFAAPDPREAMLGAVQLGLFHADYVRAGGAIYDIPPSLVERFRLTDIDDVPLQQLKLPYETVYLHFGLQRDLQWYPGWPVDGAYVTQLSAENMQFALTCAPPDVHTYHRAAQAYEPNFIIAFDSEAVKNTAGLAIDTAVAAKIARLREQTDGEAASVPSSESAEHDLAAAGIVDVSVLNAKKELDALPAKHTAFVGALRLIVNAIAYVTAYPEDYTDEWSEGAPAALIERLTSPQPKIRRKARSELVQHGHTVVRLAGRGFRAEHPSVPSAPVDTKQAGAPTWVRGHWVNQAWGPKWSLRRLRWKMPFIRNAEAGKPATSHVYLVDEHDATAALAPRAQDGGAG